MTSPTQARLQKLGKIGILALAAFSVTIILRLPHNHPTEPAQSGPIAEQAETFGEISEPVEVTTDQMEAARGPVVSAADAEHDSFGMDEDPVTSSSVLRATRGIPAPAARSSANQNANTSTRGTRISCEDDSTVDAAPPTGWQISKLPGGRRPWRTFPNIARIATDNVWSGAQSVHLVDIPNVPGPVFFWQAVDARPFRGKRVAVSAAVHPDGKSFASSLVLAWASNGPSMDFPWGGQSYERTSLVDPAGTDGWARHTSLFDVPFDSELLVYGFSPGAWVDDVRVSVVPLTSAWGEMTFTAFTRPYELLLPVPPDVVLPTPANLDFEDDALESTCDAPHPAD